MTLNIEKTGVINLTRETNVFWYYCVTSDSLVTRKDALKDLEVKLYSKLNFHVHADYFSPKP